jgi:pimeloyl-ACP methyl ester carboxylesterase
MANLVTHEVAFADWTTRVLRRGDGDEPLILLHSHGVDADMWRPLIRALPASAPVLALDLRGQGRSTSERRPFTLDLLADDVLAVLAREGVGAGTVVGVAFGGTLAQLVATKAPELTRRLVLMDSAVSRTPASRQSLLDRADQAEREGLAGLIRAAIPRWFPPAVRQPPPELLDELRASMAAIDPGHYAAVGRAFAELDLRANAAAIRCPTLILVGAEDAAMPPAASRELHALIPQSELRVLPGVGHCPPVQEPELVARLLTSTMEE